MSPLDTDIPRSSDDLPTEQRISTRHHCPACGWPIPDTPTESRWVPDLAA